MKAIKTILKSYIKDTFTPIIPNESNNSPEVRPLDPSRKSHSAGPVLSVTPALLGPGEKSAGGLGAVVVE